MRIYILSLVCLSLLSLSSFAEMPVLSGPASMEVLGNGLHSVAFVVKIKGLPEEEEEKDFKFSLKGLPDEAPFLFDKTNGLFFWNPEPHQVGTYKFVFVAEDQTGQEFSESVKIKVLKAPSLEALPKGWLKKKKEDRYLSGRDYLPSSNFVEMEIAALPEYEVEIKVKDLMDEECLLRYVPREGRAEVNKKRRTASINLGGQYASEKVKKVRRDLYEDLFNTLGLIFKKIESVSVRGGYLLENLAVFDKNSLVSAAGAENIYLPTLNLSFDDRFYEETLYSKKNPMMISDCPTIKIDFNTSSGLIWRRSRLLIDENEYHAARGGFSMVVVKPYKDVSSFDVDNAMYLLKIPVVKKLAFGEHVFVFEAENAYGMPITQKAYARVVTLPAQIEGKPLVYPSPFSPYRNKELKIQYKLSMQTNIELVVFGVDGSVVMRKRFFMGEEGARKGLNTVSWDGRTNVGSAVSNGIYSGVIIDRDENRILERFKITVYR
ncbi:MAG: hypothetical protein V3T21_00345 [Candidatus Margulisiibacteriota bacterium]